MVKLQVGRRAASDAALHRAQAVAAVIAVLHTPASAAELEARLAAEHGVSGRQARRWVGWALADLRVERSTKGANGTTYASGAAGIRRPPRSAARVPVTAVGQLAPIARRDVALAVLALRELGGRARGQDFFERVATLAERPLAWARGAACDAASHCYAVRPLGGGMALGPDTTFLLSEEAACLADSDLRRWAAPIAFNVPALDLAAAAVAVLGDGPEMEPGRTAVLLQNLAALGGCAAWCELPDGGRGVLAELRRPTSEPAPTEWLEHGRVAIATGLAEAWCVSKDRSKN